jgi:hypothetical protein
MLVQLGAILATTLAVLYAIASQPRPVAIGALAVGVSVLLVAALPPRIRGGAGDDTTRDRGGWLRRVVLSALPALGTSAAAQPESPLPPWGDLDAQLRTREGCECKAVTQDFSAPGGLRVWTEGAVLARDGPDWCDVEAGCPGAIDKTGDGPGDYHGWDRVDVQGPENALPPPEDARPPPEDVRQLLIDQSLAPRYSREVAEAVRRGATVPFGSSLLPRYTQDVSTVPRFEDKTRAVAVLGTTRPQDEGNSARDIATAAARAVPVLGVAGIPKIIERLRGQNRGKADPRHPLLTELEFTHFGGIGHSGHATFTSTSREPIILVSLVGGTGPAQVHVTERTSAPSWTDNAQAYTIWKATNKDQNSYGYTKQDAICGIGSKGVTAQTAESLSDCCATLLKFYAPPPRDENLPSIASSNVDLQVESELSPDDIAMARLPSVAHWTESDRGCMVAVRPSPSQGPQFQFSIHGLTHEDKPQGFEFWVYDMNADDTSTVAKNREKIATSTRSLMNKAKSSLSWSDMEYLEILNQYPSCSLAQIQRIVDPGHKQLIHDPDEINILTEDDEKAVRELIGALAGLQEEETPFTSETVGKLSTTIVGNRTLSTHHPVHGYFITKEFPHFFKLLYTIYEVRLRAKYIADMITRGLSTKPCTYSGDNDCTAHPLRAAMRATARKIQGDIDELGQIQNDTKLATYLAERVAGFKSFYETVHKERSPDPGFMSDMGDSVVASLPFPVWHVHHDHVVYDPKMAARNILYHMTHEIIVPYLMIPLLEAGEVTDFVVKKLSFPSDANQRQTQEFILRQVYGTKLGDLEKRLGALTGGAQPR